MRSLAKCFSLDISEAGYVAGHKNLYQGTAAAGCGASFIIDFYTREKIRHAEEAAKPSFYDLYKGCIQAQGIRQTSSGPG